MSEYKILVVEDDSDIRSLIVRQIKLNGYGVEDLENGRLAAQKLAEKNFDLIIVDWMMPELSGIELIKLLKANPKAAHTPILMLTAKNRVEDIVQGLESGADDYLVKPFDLNVLSARIKALLRRPHAVAQSQDSSTGSITIDQTQVKHLQIGNLKIDSERFTVSILGQEVLFTPMEFKLLWAMMRQAGKVLTRNKLIELAAGPGVSVTGRTVDTHLFAVRKKLGSCSDYLETVRGVGYRIKAQD